MDDAWQRIAEELGEERYRQIAGEGYGPEHDDALAEGALARAAATYAFTASLPADRQRSLVPSTAYGLIQALWPRGWRHHAWKPKNRRRDLVRAGALIIAAIEQVDRSTPDENAPPRRTPLRQRNPER